MSSIFPNYLRICVLVNFLFISKISAQNNIPNSLGKYERTSVSYFLLNIEEEKYMGIIKSVFPKVKVNDKYNNHLLSDLNLSNTYSRFYMGMNKDSLVKQKLEENKIGNKIIAKWFSQKSDGYFSMNLIAERGIYNATDADVLRANAGKRGTSALQDAGESLLRKSFAISFDFINVESWDDYYDRQDNKLAAIAAATNTSPKKTPRIYYGYRGAAIAYVSKVDWNDSLANIFYEQAWKDPKVFARMNFPIKHIAQFYIPRADGSQLRVEGLASNEDLMQKFVQNAIEKSLIEISRGMPEFRVKIPVFSDRPVKAKIGLKEDVSIDQRFFVYEMIENKNKDLIPRKRGVVRASKHIIDNRNNSNGETLPTRFYQESGKRIYAGMLLEQRYDYGISLSGGWGIRSLQGPMVRLDYNLSKLLNISLFRFYLEGQIGFGSIKLGNSTTSHVVSSYSIIGGFSKEYPLLRNLHLEPHLGFVFDSTSISLSKDKISMLNSTSTGIRSGISTFGLIIGLRIPINILHNLQLVPGVSLSTVIFSKAGSLFGRELPSNLPLKFKEADGITQKDDSDNDWKKNSNANLNRNLIKWEILLRYKF